MTDYTELKRLADAANAVMGDVRVDVAITSESGPNQDEIDSVTAFLKLATPAAVMALIVENDRLKTLRSTTERDLAQELEVWKHGPSCWNCGDTGDVHDMVGEWRGQCDCNAAKLIDVSSERDQLKDEIEALRKDAERYRWLRGQHWNKSEMAVVCQPKKAVKLGFDCPSEGRLDCAVDTAMGKGEQS